jgi:hypothetical protein
LPPSSSDLLSTLSSKAIGTSRYAVRHVDVPAQRDYPNRPSATLDGQERLVSGERQPASVPSATAGSW